MKKRHLNFLTIFIVIFTIGCSNTNPVVSSSASTITDTPHSINPTKTVIPTRTKIPETNTPTPTPDLYSEAEIQKMAEELKVLPSLVLNTRSDVFTTLPNAEEPKIFYIKDTPESQRLQELTGYYLKLWALGRGDLVPEIDVPYVIMKDWSNVENSAELNIKGPIVWTKESLKAYEDSGEAHFFAGAVVDEDVSASLLFPSAEFKVYRYEYGEKTPIWTDVIHYGRGITLGIKNWRQFSIDMSPIYASHGGEFELGVYNFEFMRSRRPTSLSIPLLEDGRIALTDILILPKGDIIKQIQHITKFSPSLEANLIDGQFFIDSGDLNTE